MLGVATYKVIQDIEAEDKFLGPLTLKQFIFAAITAVCLYLSVFGLSRGLWFLAVMLLPFELIFGFLAFPWGRDQPTEVWLLAKIRYYMKPRRRIWDQTGMLELVTITAPKKIDVQLTDNLSQTEVRSRLKALADTIDSRGWAIKNVNVNMFAEDTYNASMGVIHASTDRLIDASAVPQQSITADVTANDDIFENQLAQQLDSQLAQSRNTGQSRAIERMKEAQNEEVPGKEQTRPDYWFMDQPDMEEVKAPKGYTMFGATKIQPTPVGELLPTEMRRSGPASREEQTALNEIRRHKQERPVNFRNHRTITPLSEQTVAPPPDIIKDAQDNNRSVASIAREHNKNYPEQPRVADDNNEVTVRLH